MKDLVSMGSDLPDFEQLDSQTIAANVRYLLKHAQSTVDTIGSDTSAVSWSNFIEPLELACEKLSRAWSVLGHMNSVTKSDELRNVYSDLLGDVTQFWTQLSQNLAIYQRYLQLQNSTEFAQLDASQKKYIENSIRDFKLGGADLSDQNKIIYSQIQDELALLNKEFSDHALDATDFFRYHTEDLTELAGIPDDVIKLAQQTATELQQTGFVLTLQFPCYFPVMQYAQNRKLRETLYKAYVTRASELSHEYGCGPLEWNNADNILKQLNLKRQEAQLLGFENYAQLSLATKMAQSTSEVSSFLLDIAQRAKPFAQAEWQEICEYAKTHLHLDQVEPWDVSFISEKIKLTRYSYSETEVKQYFQLPNVLNGLFEVIQTIFEVRIAPHPLSTWHKDVLSYKITDSQAKDIAYFYLDPYARVGKRSGAWMDDARGRKKSPHSKDQQLPVAYLVCNFPPPHGTKASTITHDDVITLFHEFGHGLHHMLTQINTLGVSGINGVEWDAVELPSQFMENFCWEWEVIQKMSGHVDTHQKLPKELFEKMYQSKNFQNGLSTLRQIVFAMTDWLLHSEFDAQSASYSDLLSYTKKIHENLHVVPSSEISRWLNSFTHVFAGGYAAGYYSYKWAEVLSADAYSKFEEASQSGGTVLDPKVGQHFKKAILEMGGSRTALESFKHFMGREPKIDALLRHGGLSR